MEGVPVVIMVRHRFGAHDSVDVAKRALCHKVSVAQQTCRNCPRHLDLEIEDHRTTTGKLDADARELWRFIVRELLDYLTYVTVPWESRHNKIPQRNDDESLLMLALML